MEKNITNQKNIIIKAVILVVIFFIAIFFFVISIKKDLKNQEYMKNTTSDIDYKVNINPNTYITSQYLGKNQAYISDLIKNITANFKYNINFSKSFSTIKYRYNITAKIQGTYKESTESTPVDIWDKEYTLLSKDQIELKNSTGFNIDEKIDIDYNFYNNQISEFRSALKLPVNATLFVYLNVYTYFDNQKEDETTNIEIEIPLNQPVFKIKENYEPTTKTLNGSKEANVNYIYLTIGILLILLDISIVIFIPSFRNIFFIKNKKTYKKNLDKLLKGNEEIMIEISNDLNISSKNIIEVKSFEDILDIESELNLPILYIKNNNQTTFYILYNENIFKYLLKNEDN